MENFRGKRLGSVEDVRYGIYNELICQNLQKILQTLVQLSKKFKTSISSLLLPVSTAFILLFLSHWPISISYAFCWYYFLPKAVEKYLKKNLAVADLFVSISLLVCFFFDKNARPLYCWKEQTIGVHFVEKIPNNVYNFREDLSHLFLCFCYVRRFFTTAIEQLVLF